MIPEHRPGSRQRSIQVSPPLQLLDRRLSVTAGQGLDSLQTGERGLIDFGRIHEGSALIKQRSDPRARIHEVVIGAARASTTI